MGQVAQPPKATFVTRQIKAGFWAVCGVVPLNSLVSSTENAVEGEAKAPSDEIKKAADYGRWWRLIMCNAIHQFQPAIHAAEHRRQQELGRILGYCNFLALFRQWRTAVANLV